MLINQYIIAYFPIKIHVLIIWYQIMIIDIYIIPQFRLQSSEYSSYDIRVPP